VALASESRADLLRDQGDAGASKLSTLIGMVLRISPGHFDGGDRQPVQSPSIQ